MNIQELNQTGFVVDTYPRDLRTAVISTASLWQDFCALPEDIKKNLPYSNNSAGIGYEFKDGTGNAGDRKENFDITLEGKSWLQENAGKIDPAVATFVENALGLVELIKPTALEFAHATEQAFDMPGLANEVSDIETTFFVRFIHYFSDQPKDAQTAHAHTDQGGFTLHLYESDPGLQCLPKNGDWMDMPVSTGQTVIIPSMQMQLRSEGKLTALCHRVVATEETAKHGRFSAVCFVQLKDTPKYNKKEYGRLQEKTPGFNYDIPHEEFLKFFI